MIIFNHLQLNKKQLDGIEFENKSKAWLMHATCKDSNKSRLKVR